jgi:carbamoyl-phosphate synthase large subunit
VLPQHLVLGTSPGSIDAAEDRDQWASLCARLEIPQPAGGTASDYEGARAVAARIGYPSLVRPSYVLGGRAMEIVYDDTDLERAMAALTSIGSLGREGGLSAERPVLVDRFLEDAIEVDVDAIRDAGGDAIIGGVMEHVEEAGVHSGDSACVLPPPNLSDATIAVLEDYTLRIAADLDVVGLINVQFAVKDNESGAGQVFVIEANPRASRTVPFVAKATGRPLAKIAARVMAGATLDELRVEGLLPARGWRTTYFSVKEAVLPFNRFPESDALLGPEMRSTGEVMGVDITPGLAFVKSQIAAGNHLARDAGLIFLSLADRDKAAGLEIARLFAEMGFRFAATAGTAAVLRAGGLDVETELAKIIDGRATTDRPRTALDLIVAGEASLVINTPRGRGARADGGYIRTAAAQHGVPLLTTLSAARAAARGLAQWNDDELVVRSLQSLHATLA